MNKHTPATGNALADMIVAAWNTNNRVTIFLVESMPEELWSSTIPGMSRRSIHMLAGHIHNARCMWVKTLGKEHGILPPASVDRHKVGRTQLIRALERSGTAIARLLALGCERGGRIPDSKAYIWRNLPLDVGHVLGYFTAHEGHHRGQIVMAARQLGYRLPISVTGGLWQWSKWAKEANADPKSHAKK